MGSSFNSPFSSSPPKMPWQMAFCCGVEVRPNLSKEMPNHE